MNWNVNKLRKRSGAVRHRPIQKPYRPRVERLETRLAPANVPVLKAHYDNLISGANTQETLLTPANVNATNFGRLFNYPVDGYIYAQPLYVPNLTIAGGTHNVVFAATEHDSVYAFDADGGGQLWRRSFIDPANGITSVPQPDVISGDVVPEVGITGTPVIDLATSTMYVVPKTKEIVGGTAHFVQRLHALDITTGATRAGGVSTIGDTINQNDNTSTISVPGGGDGSVNGVLTFNARKEHQRPGLNLVNGIVYIGWASHGDNGPYHGWVVGYDATNIGAGPVKVFNTSPNGSASGIWMSGGGIAADAQNNLYFATGNGFGTGFAPGTPFLVGGGGGGLGYAGIAPSLSVRFRNFPTETGLGINGSFGPGVSMPGFDFNASAQANPRHTFTVTLAYNSATQVLTEMIQNNNVPSQTFTTSYNVNLPGIIGGNTAVVGFTGGTGGLNAQQDIQTWTYSTGGTTVIDHSAGFASASDLQANGSSSFTGTVARITPAANGQAGSVFSRNQVNITNFSTTFTFQMSAGSNPIADGMTFTIQNGGGSFSESVLKLSTTGQLSVADYFTPFDWRVLDAGDADLGSGGTMLLPDAVGTAAHPHLMIETGKTGRMYLIDRDAMGRNNPNPAGPDFNLQTVTIGGPGVWGNPSFFQDGPNTGLIYYWGTSSPMKGFRITNGMINPNPVTTTDPLNFGFPGAQPSISANGMSNAIAWALRVDNFGQNGPATLFAFSATNFQQQLYSSDATGLRDRYGGSVKFVFPIVSNGHVYAGSNGFLSVFGLFPAVTAAPNAPSNLNGTPVQGGTQIQLSWTNPTGGQPATGIKILRSTDGVTFTQVNTVARDVAAYTDTGLRPATLYHYQVVAANQAGDSPPSNTLDIRSRVAGPVLRIPDVCVGSFSVSWTATANDHYDLERGDANGANFVLIASVDASQTSFMDTGLANGTFTYRVTGFSVFPEGSDFAVSNVARGTIGPVNIAHGNPGSQQPGFQDHSDVQSNGSAQFTTENLLRLTNDFGQAASVFTLQQVGARGFTTSFDIRLHEGTQPNPADGLTFTLQGNNPAALGAGGGALGYQGIGKSVAVMFKIWQNPGDPSANTTGILFNGQDPTGRGTDVTPSGVNLRSQTPKQITLSYNGTTLTERIEDLFSHAVFTASYTVDIPSFVGGDTAYVGFTAGTGGAFVLQDVLNWTYTEQEGNLAPRAPGDLRITSVDRHDHNRSDINLAWNCNNAYTAQGFIIEKSTDGINYATLATVDNGTTTFTDERVGADPQATDPLTLYYRVRSFNDVGLSRPSNVDSAKLFGGDRGLMIDHSTGFASHSDLTANGATFSPDPMAIGTFLGHQDIGNVGIPGSATFANGTYTVRGSGADIWDVADGFQFLYKRLNGNGEIIARVTSTQFTDFFSKAGVMIREGLDANSKNALMLLFPPGHDNVEFGRRIETSGCCFADGASISVRPQWVRLVRNGNNFSAFRSDNGTSWIQVGPTVTINMSTIAFVGLAVTAHNNSAINTATFDNVSIIGDSSVPLPPTVARLTDGAFGEANTIFTNNRVGISTFTTSFTYQVQPRIGSADGLAFVIQGNSPNARGGGGGGLGYTGIARSVAVKFDIWNLATHRSSTGIYFDGEAPDSADGRSRSIFMDTDPNPANRINFNNSHVFRIDFSYDGTTLTETVTDTGGTASFTTSYVVDIAAHVGSNFGYVGFSGGTGGETAVQDILTWTYKFNESHPGGGAGPSSFGGGGTPDPVIATNEAALLPGIANDSDDFSFDARMLMASAARSTAPEETAVLDERNQTANSLNRWSGELVNGQLPSVIESRLPLAVDQVFSGVQRRIGTLYERADTAIDQLFAQDFF